MTRTLLIAGMLFCLVACSSNQQKDTETAMAAANTLALQGLQRTLPGLYGNYAQHWASSQDTGETSTSEHWRLNINALRSASGEAWFSLHQYPGSDASQGNTSLLQFSFAADQLVLRFSPYTDSNAPRDLNADQLAAVAQFLPGCEIRLSRLTAVLAGQTRATTCQLAAKDGAMLSLIKDYSFSARSIDIGDRIIEPVSGDSLGEDRIFRFTRMLQFRGWAGLKSEDEEDWRLARPLEIWSDGDTAQLVDLSGAPMGYKIRLAQVPWRTDQDPILRLDLIESGTGEIIAYSWADKSAQSLGINLGWIQIGLTQILP